MEATRLLLVSDLKLFREGMVFALRHGLAVTVEVSSWAELDRACGRLTPGAAAMLHLPEPQAVTIAQELVRQQWRVLVLAGVKTIPYLVSYAVAGVSAIIFEDSPLEELLFGIKQALAGQEYLASGPFGLQALRDKAAGYFENWSGLTRREQEIAGLLAKGFGNKQIASQLHISVHTVKHHVHNILEKSAIGSRTELFNSAPTGSSSHRRVAAV